MDEVKERIDTAPARLHKLRAYRMRICDWLGIPCRLLPAVPENDRGALLRLRLALEIRRRDKQRALRRIRQALGRRREAEARRRDEAAPGAGIRSTGSLIAAV